LAKYISLDLIPDPFIILDSDGKIYDINFSCSELIGTERNNLIGTDFRNYKPFQRLWERVSHALINKKEDFERITLNNKHFEVNIFPFKIKGDLNLIRILFKDISNFVRLEKELLKRNKELIIVNTLSSAFISSENMDKVIEDLFAKVLLITDFSIGWLLLNENQSYKLKIHRDISSEFKRSIEDGTLDSLCNDLIESGEPIYIFEAYEISKYELFFKEGIVFSTVIPLVSDKEHIGFLFLASRDRKEDDFDFDIATLLSHVGNTVSVIFEKIKLFQETKRLSITDSLTGLYNMRSFYKSLDNEIARTKRYGDSFSLILFDIDNFKKINDTCGHQAGDVVLQNLATVLKSMSRETDIVVRYGGEEFIIILPNTSEEEAISLAHRIREAAEENTPVINGNLKVNITISGGIASYPQNASNARFLLHAADSALYSAKAAGKNKVLCYKGKFHEKNI
jgi:diguanylate cyclase (GGDEF)-like protein